MAEDSSKYQLIVTKHGNGDLLISRSGVAILEIDVFPDTSHKGDHLFLTPLKWQCNIKVRRRT